MNAIDEGDPVLERNTKVANMWSSGGHVYNEVSQGVAEGIRQWVMRLAPQEGERDLDIAKGLLDAARHLAEKEKLSIDWQLGDAEKLPFADASFDVASSTFGVMFATNQEAAIGELARVVRPGVRFGIAAWLPDSTAVELRQFIAPFMPPVPQQASAPPSPFNWGDPAWLSDNLGEYFELGHEPGELTHRANSPEDAWGIYEDGFGPIRLTAQALEADQRLELKAAFENRVDGFSADLGVSLTPVPCDSRCA